MEEKNGAGEKKGRQVEEEIRERKRRNRWNAGEEVEGGKSEGERRYKWRREQVEREER